MSDITSNVQANTPETTTLATQISDDTYLITAQKFQAEALETAMYNYQSKKHSTSSFINDQNGTINFKPTDIDRLALNAQSSLKNILEINTIVRFFINKNDILGKVHETIETNVNEKTEIKYANYTESDENMYIKVKELIEDFNEKIDLENLIISSIPMTFDEGNYISYLRKNSKTLEYQLDYFPLGVAEISDYKADNEPYVLINIKELTSRLKKNYDKNKKGKALFFKNEIEEIKANYPKEVYDAYKNKEKYAILPIENTCLLRINNMNRKYGLTPMFKSLKNIIRIDTIEESDFTNTQARGKKIIFQKLRKELITDADKISKVTWYEAQAKAHDDFITAWANNPVIYTPTPWVEDVLYVEPKILPTDVETKKQNKVDIMTSLGINFLNSNGAINSANISIAQLMRMINKIGKQLEKVLKKFWKGILIDNNIDEKYCPEISIIDSELLETSLKMEIARFMFAELGMSFESAYNMMDRDFNTEKLLRQKENKEKLDTEVFYARTNGFTVSGKDNPNNNKGGTPIVNKDTDKKQYDKNRTDGNET